MTVAPGIRSRGPGGVATTLTTKRLRPPRSILPLSLRPPSPRPTTSRRTALGKESVMAITTQDRSELVNVLLERIAQTVGENAKASTIFGDPVESAGVTVVPVAKARFGFGGGGGSGTRDEGEGQGRGGGGGVAVSPVG